MPYDKAKDAILAPEKASFALQTGMNSNILNIKLLRKGLK